MKSLINTLWRKLYGALWLVILGTVLVGVAKPQLLADRHATLTAKPWNNDQVHLWSSLVESEATHIDLPGGTVCRYIDHRQHRLIGPPPPIYYYHVRCGAVSGYVEADQVR